MRDIIVVAIVAGFFALCVAYVRWCDRIIGPDPDDLRDDEVDEVDVEGVVGGPAAAGASSVEVRPFDAEAVRS